MENLHELRQIFLQILNEEQGAPAAEAESDKGNLEAKGSMSDYKNLIADHAHKTALGQEGNADAVRMAQSQGRNFHRDVVEAHLNHLHRLSQDPNADPLHIKGHRDRIFALLGGKKKAAMQTASTDYSRLMLKSLFEALIEAGNLGNIGTSNQIGSQSVGQNMRVNMSQRGSGVERDVSCPTCGEQAELRPSRFRHYGVKAKYQNDGHYYCNNCEETVET